MNNSIQIKRVDPGDGSVPKHFTIMVALYGTVATFIVEAGKWSSALAHQTELELGDEVD